MSIADLQRGSGRGARVRVCPLCRETKTEVILEVKLAVRDGQGRGGSTAVRGRTVCEACGVRLFESFAKELRRDASS